MDGGDAHRAVVCMRPIWMIYYGIRHSDTFETFLEYMESRGIVVTGIEYDDYRVDQYDHGNPLWMSLRDVVDEHLWLEIEYPGLDGRLAFEWDHGYHSVTHEKNV